MAYKFPWTNYHELNLDWILDTVKKLFAQTEQNNAVVEQYDGRLTEVELTADNAQTAAEQAQSDSAAALSLAQGAQTTATQAQQAAAQAQQAAGQAQTAAGQALEAAATAQQTATQAQQTAQNFDGRITQAENNAASALHAAQAFDEQVQGAITAANNANTAATTALTKATETERELAAQRSTLEGIVSDGVDSLQEATQDATEEIEAAGQTVLDSIPSDYTTLSELVDKKADVIYNTAAGDIASFNDGADDMKIKSLVVNIEPVQAGSGDPAPDNVRPISGHTGAEIEQTGKNLCAGATYNATIYTAQQDGTVLVNGTADSARNYYFTTQVVAKSNAIKLPAGTYTGSFSVLSGALNGTGGFGMWYWEGDSETRQMVQASFAGNKVSHTFADDAYIIPSFYLGAGGTAINAIVGFQIERGSDKTDFVPYTGDQISVTFPSEAGTVYGGTLTINPDRTGQLVVDRFMAEPDKDVDATVSSSTDNVIVYQILMATNNYPIADRSNADAISNRFSTSIPSNTPGRMVVNTTQFYLVIAKSELNTFDVLGFRNWLDAHPTQVSYKIATPVTYTMTESQINGILSTLYGTNNIWADTGDVEVTYPADTKTYIDNKFAELQALILEH